MKLTCSFSPLTRSAMLVLAASLTFGCGDDEVETPDAGVVADSGVAADSGVVADTGVTPDSGVTPDAGTPPDSGVIPDAGGPIGTVHRAVLSGGQEAPPFATSAGGTASVVLSDDETSFEVTAEFTGLTDTIGAHIHVGDPGDNGPVAFVLSADAFTSPLTATLDATNLQMGSGLANFQEAVDALEDGRLYFNLHTMASPSGELRGQIGAVEVASTLTGSQEAPPFSTDAIGRATISLNATQTQISVSVEFTNLTNTTAAHIHFGPPGENGPVIFPLAGAPYTSPLQATLTEALLMTNDGVSTMDEAVTALLSGRTYFNLHTTNNPPGELRGQIGAVFLRSALSGLQQAPPIDSAGTGEGMVSINAQHTEVRTRVDFSGFTDTIAAHLHVAPPGENGAVVFPLATATFTSPLEVTLDEDDVSVQAPAGILSFDHAVGALIGGGLYFNLHTTTNAAGELRGQIGPVRLAANLSGVQEAPSVDTAATGTGVVTISADQRSISVAAPHTGLAGTTAAHLHVGDPGQNGPVIFVLSGGPFTSPLTAQLSASDLMPQAGAGVADFDGALHALIGGRAYFNLHTATNAPGELRGQIGPVRMRANLSGAQQVHDVSTMATGSASVLISADQRRVIYDSTFTGLSDTTAAHIHTAQAGANGGVILPLAGAGYTSPLNVTLTEADLTPQMGAGVADFGGAVNALIAGRAYVNMHTAANAPGELRGQIGAVRLRGALGGAQEVPSIFTAATGSGDVTLSPDQREVRVTVTHSGLVDTTAAHIHTAGVGANGPVIFPLAGAAFTSPTVATLTAADLVANPSIATFEEALDALMTGRTYFNLHTMANPPGELRGQIGPFQVRAGLSGAEEVPAISTAADGSATVSVSADQRTISVNAEFTGLTDTTAAHLHTGGPGTNGPVIFPLAGAGYTSPLQATLTAADLMSQPGAGVADFDAAISALVAGRVYFNLHTMANAPGELRGQAGAIRVASVLSGGQQVTPVMTGAAGEAVVSIAPDHRSLQVAVDFTGLMNASAAHIHLGAIGMDGPIVLPLADGGYTSPLTITASAMDLMAQPMEGIDDFDDLISAIITGRTYFNLHTSTNPTGELRGQIGPISLTATLDGTQEAPPVMTAASGTGAVQISADHTQIRVQLTHTALAEITAAHIHTAGVGSNGPIILPVASASFASPFSVTLGASDVVAAPGAGVNSLADAIEALITGNTYFNVHTLTNAPGEIRGQIQP